MTRKHAGPSAPRRSEDRDPNRARVARQSRELMEGSMWRHRSIAASVPVSPVQPAVRRRVLLLAEHHLIRSGVSMFLEGRGYRIDISWDEASAMALVAAEAPHAAVLDYGLGMPETLRVADVLASMFIPMLFFTSPLVDAGMGDHGGAPCLEKPCSPGMLAAAVKDLFGPAPP